MLTGHDRGPTESHAHWYEYLLERFPELSDTRRPTWLSLCCGTGQLERYFGQKGVFESCLALDASVSAIDEAKRMGEVGGLRNVTYRVADLNEVELPDSTFDVVVVQGGLHHIVALERLLERVNRSLTTDGLFLMHEYVGPSRQRFGPRQREVVNALMHLVPPKYRKRPIGSAAAPLCAGEDGAEREIRRVTSVASRARSAIARGDWPYLRRRTVIRAAGVYSRVFSVLADVRYGRGPYARLFRPERLASGLWSDPSESVRSGELLAMVEAFLDIIEVKPVGGTALWWLQDFDWSSSPDDSAHDMLIEMLIAVERTLVLAGDLESDVVHVAARRRAS